MRFLVMVKATQEWDGELPTAEMGAFNETLVRDGILLAAEGLQPSSKGARISFANARAAVTDGPFAETKELIAGFWIVQARSKEEVVERFSHCPFERGESLEIRQIFEAEDFSGSDEMVANRLARMREHNRAETSNSKP